MLNSGYEMPVNGLGTYSLHGDECINAVKSALSNGVRLIDTASAYGNEAEIGQAIHPYYQENDVIPFIQDLGIVVQERHPLGAEGIRHTGELLGDSVISEIAGAHGVSSAQVILRWNLQKGVVVIIGYSNPDHIRENTELYDFELTKDEMVRIGALDSNEKHDWY